MLHDVELDEMVPYRPRFQPSAEPCDISKDGVDALYNRSLQQVEPSVKGVSVPNENNGRLGVTASPPMPRTIGWAVKAPWFFDWPQITR